jgi:hypothetical protein
MSEPLMPLMALITRIKIIYLISFSSKEILLRKISYHIFEQNDMRKIFLPQTLIQLFVARNQGNIQLY